MAVLLAFLSVADARGGSFVGVCGDASAAVLGWHARALGFATLCDASAPLEVAGRLDDSGTALSSDPKDALLQSVLNQPLLDEDAVGGGGLGEAARCEGAGEESFLFADRIVDVESWLSSLPLLDRNFAVMSIIFLTCGVTTRVSL